MQADKIIGDTLQDLAAVFFPYAGGMMAAGSSNSPQFREGTTAPQRDGMHIFLSYLTYFPLGIPEAAPQPALELYPNPVHATLYFSKALEGKPFTMYNLTGIQVLSGKANISGMDVSHLPQGVYFIKTTGKIGKVIKE